MTKKTQTHSRVDHQSRRKFLKLGLAAGASLAMPFRLSPAAAQAKVNLTYISYELTSAAAGPELKRQLAEFEKANPGITVEGIPTPLAQYTAKVVAQAKAGEMPDIATADVLWLRGWIKEGYLKDLTPYVEKAGGKAFLGKFYDSLIQLASDAGKVYAIPSFAGGYIIYYNTEMYKEAGLDPNKPPTNWDELLTYCKKLTKKDASGNTVQWGWGIHGQNIPADVSRFLQWMYSNGADPLSPDGKTALLDQPKAIETLKFWSELYTKHGVVPPGAVQAGPGEVRSMFAQKKIAMLVGIIWGLDQVFAENPAVRNATAIAPFPKQVPNAPSLFQAVYNGMSANTKHPEEAWKVLEYFARPESGLALYKATRYGPVRPDIFAHAEVKNDPYAQVLAKVNQHLKPPPTIPQWERVSKIIGDAMQRALTGAKTPEAAFKEANAQINPILKQS
jgi:ABC-type glycerol-3-phosphate transport system substrate-binding protein